MEGLARRDPELGVEIFTLVPEWFLRESLSMRFGLHHVETDVGLRQLSAFEADLDETVSALRAFLSFDRPETDALASKVVALGCDAVLCDISPLGIEIARRAGLPSVLVENFTWDWIYEGFADTAPALAEFAESMRELFACASLHVQTEPVCLRSPSADLVTKPVSRLPRRDRLDTRLALGVHEAGPVVLVTMGGVPQALEFEDDLRRRAGVRFLVTGAPVTAVSGNVHWFDNDTPLYLPDLVRADVVVVAKLGYSTVAEVWREGRPMAYVTRRDFRESSVLERFARSEMVGFAITAADFQGAGWLASVDDLLRHPRRSEPKTGGTDDLAAFLIERLGQER